MLNKKSPKANLENKRAVPLLMGLVIAMSVLYIALEWSSREIPVYVKTEIIIEDPVYPYIPPTKEAEKLPKPPKPIIEIEKKATTPTVIGNFNPMDSIGNLDSLRTFSILENNPIPKVAWVDTPPELTEPVDFLPAEDMPKFRKGNLTEYISKRIKYPEVAQRNGIGGTVFCEFIIDENGSVTNVRIVRGIDPDIDKEVIRVVENLPKWEPGKQNQKPVKVRQTIPVKFTVNR